MADLEAVARWCEGMAAREDAAAASASGAEFHSEAREYRRQAAMHRVAAAACREAMRHRGFMYNVTEISDASAATDAALNAIKEAP